ncbi:hypothetical protein ACFQL1_08095 [Halomicroarcula sp. GCM10025709]|uniref:hypothetical protein n=1 Tax=Haloarcula TaxID=2237 RepID=UPI0024C3B924|nr:hypothetical protein [Halomicroarcula sp. YJ-61-S]
MDDDDDREAARVAEAIDEVGVDRLADAIVEAWDRGGVDADAELTWPETAQRYRLELTDPDEPAGMDVFATALDHAPGSPEAVAVDIELGRRDTLAGDQQTALERLAANPGVTAGTDRTQGTAPATLETIDALARLPGDAVTHAVVLDEDGRAIVERRTRTTVRFALPESRDQAAVAGLAPAVVDRLVRESA